MKNISFFLSENFQFLEEKFSVYLNLNPLSPKLLKRPLLTLNLDMSTIAEVNRGTHQKPKTEWQTV